MSKRDYPKEEQNLADYWKVMRKKKRMIVGLTFLIVLFTAIISFVIPKTYESESIIQIGSVGGKRVSTESSKHIIQGSLIVLPVIAKFFPKDEGMTLQKFNKKNLEVELIKEQLDYSSTEIIPYLSIQTKANNAIKAKEINEEIIKQFFSYAKPDYEERLEIIKKDLDATEQSIVHTKEAIKQIENEIISLSDKELGGYDNSKAVLLKSILSDYNTRLREDGNRKVSIEKELFNSEEYKIISQPQIPLKPSEPKRAFNLAISLVLGLFISVFLAFFTEAIKKE